MKSHAAAHLRNAHERLKDAEAMLPLSRYAHVTSLAPSTCGKMLCTRSTAEPKYYGKLQNRSSVRQRNS